MFHNLSLLQQMPYHTNLIDKIQTPLMPLFPMSRGCF